MLQWPGSGVIRWQLFVTFQMESLSQSCCGVWSTCHWRNHASGAATLSVWYILDGHNHSYKPHLDPSISPEPPWTVPLMGLLNILVWIDKKKWSHQDSAILDKLQGSYCAVCAIIWHDLSHLLPPGPQADFRQQIIMLYIGNMLMATANKKCIIIRSLLSIHLTYSAWIVSYMMTQP